VHALRFPPRHLWRTAFLALLLTVAAMAAGIALSSADLGSREPAATGSSPATVEPVRTHPGADPPAWVTDPLRPPTFELDR
jgi:hypothetical protein